MCRWTMSILACKLNIEKCKKILLDFILREMIFFPLFGQILSSSQDFKSMQFHGFIYLTERKKRLFLVAVKACTAS